MSLPVTNLDDRKFQDLVDEAKRLIPKHCKEWTNHNLSDPGVALIELFAWMTELTLYRLNQVPDTFFTRMLNLVGFQPFPATASRADLTFWLVEPTDHAVVVPAGTQVATGGAIGDTRVFTTLADLVISQPKVIASLTSTGPDAYQDVWEPLRLDTESIVTFPRAPLTPGDAWYIGFESSLAGNAIRLDLTANVQGIGVIPDRPPLRWEVWQGEGWVQCDVYGDTTGGLNRDGSVVLLVPQAHERLILGAQPAFWLRAKLLAPEPDQPGYRASPQVRRLRAVSLGGSALAEHSDGARGEILGTSTGAPDQVFVTRHQPVLPRQEGEDIEVVVGTERVTWTKVDDFVSSGPDDRHYTWDDTTGEVRFGPLIRYPDPKKVPVQHGAVPPQGAQVVATSYRFGGGEAGNVGPRTLTALRTTIPYVARVENLKAASGGVDAETVDNAKLRGPQSLRAGARAVTPSDYERLASEADPSIARVRCLPPLQSGDPIRLLVVPKLDDDNEQPMLDDFALPDRMVAKVSSFLDDRRILGTSVEIGTPFYQGVTIAALVAARPGRAVSVVRQRVMEALYGFLNPLTGGVRGDGWPFDADLNAASVIQLIETIEGVERVDEVLFFEYDLRNHERLGFGRELVRLSPDALFLSANHQVVVR